MSKPKIEVIKKIYWTCNNPVHRHMTREIAEQCEDLHACRGTSWPKWTDEMLDNLVRKYAIQGQTFKQIAQQEGRSTGRIREKFWFRIRMIRYHGKGWRFSDDELRAIFAKTGDSYEEFIERERDRINTGPYVNARAWFHPHNFAYVKSALNAISLKENT